MPQEKRLTLLQNQENKVEQSKEPTPLKAPTIAQDEQNHVEPQLAEATVTSQLSNDAALGEQVGATSRPAEVVLTPQSSNDVALVASQSIAKEQIT